MMENYGLTEPERNARLEKYNHALFTSMAHCTDAVWELDAEREIVYIMHDRINPSLAHCSFSFAQIRSKIYSETHPDFRDSVIFQISQEYIRNLTDSVSTETMTMIDDRYHQLRCTMTPSIDAAGNVIAAYMTIQDMQSIMDERQVHRENQEELKRYLSAVNCGIIQYTRDSLRLVFANDIALEIFGYASISEMQADGFDGVVASVHPDDAVYLKKLVAQLKTDDDSFDYEYRITRRDGTNAVCFGRVRMISNGVDEPIIQRSIIDITQQVEMHARLDAAEHANRAKTVFLNNMSHDIRTPMNAIIGYTDLARNHLEDSHRVLDYLNKISVSSQHLLNLINDVLDMSRIESGKVVITETENDILDLIHGIRNMVQSNAMNKQLNLDINTISVNNSKVWCDKLRLNQVLINIIGNSVKFTPEGGTIGLSVEQLPDTKPGYGNYQFKIWDTGIGMSPEFVSRIFEPFEREETSTVSGIQGTGLGMSIVKNIIDLMKGQITVESEKGKGTCTTIVLSLKYGRSETFENQEHQHVQNIRDIRVLLVEDNLLNREIATVILEEAGAAVDIAENGSEAVDKVIACSECYDVVLMDIQMPVMDGYEASRRIRSLDNPEKAAVPIIAMTANAFAEDRQKAADAGMNAHIAKPIQIDTVFETIAKTLKSR